MCEVLRSAADRIKELTLRVHMPQLPSKYRTPLIPSVLPSICDAVQWIAKFLNPSIRQAIP